jgi:uncharacterized membrane protein
MTGKIGYLWDRLKVSIWFVPLVMSLGAVILAMIMLDVDVRYGSIPWDWVRLLRIDAQGVRQVVAVISGAMMTITGVVFSVSVVTLALASNQFGPKVLRNYLHDTGNKLVLGLFVATFIYALLILASVDTAQGGFVPIWSMFVSLLLTVLATGGLIYYIHNISTAIQADHVIALIGEELNNVIDTMLVPFEHYGNSAPLTHKQEWSVQKQGLKRLPIYSAKSGYLQVIDYKALVSFATEHNVFLEIDKHAGHFVIEGSSIGSCYAYENISDATAAQILSLVIFGRQRTPVQDVEFSIMQLLQIALRALSPGINDSLTGITCIDWLSAALGRMSGCAFPPSCFRDPVGVLRVVSNGFSFEGAVNSVFDPLRQSARGNEMVTIRLLEVLERVIGVAKKVDYCAVLLAQAELIHEAAIESIPGRSDRKVVTDCFARCQLAFENTERVLLGSS